MSLPCKGGIRHSDSAFEFQRSIGYAGVVALAPEWCGPADGVHAVDDRDVCAARLISQDLRSVWHGKSTTTQFECMTVSRSSDSANQNGQTTVTLSKYVN
jgi:hypothetical protein